MIDNKVIKGLEHCIKTSCESCPYNAIDVNDSNQICLINEMLSDAISMLNEQDERIKTLEHQLDTLTKWRANAGAFD